MGKQQKSRAKKVSKGIHGGGGKGRPLTGVEKVLLGHGALQSIRLDNTKRAKKLTRQGEDKEALRP